MLRLLLNNEVLFCRWVQRCCCSSDTPLAGEPLAPATLTTCMPMPDLPSTRGIDIRCVGAKLPAEPFCCFSWEGRRWMSWLDYWQGTPGRCTGIVRDWRCCWGLTVSEAMLGYWCRYNGHVVAKLPFEPFSLLAKLAHRGIPTPSANDCSFVSAFAFSFPFLNRSLKDHSVQSQ